jgi:hypothetical protein
MLVCRQRRNLDGVPFGFAFGFDPGVTMTDFTGKVFVFSGETLEAALTEWEEEQIAVYPHKEELIRTVTLAMRDFMDSEQVGRHKMALKGQDDG